MIILYLLLPLSLLFVLVIGVSLWWAVFSGQYDDTDNAGAAILRDDDGGWDDARLFALLDCAERRIQVLA